MLFDKKIQQIYKHMYVKPNNKTNKKELNKNMRNNL